MPQKTFAQKAEDIEGLLAEVEQELQAAPDERARQPLSARKGSLLRSLDWYRARIPRARPIEHVGIGVADDVTTADAPA